MTIPHPPVCDIDGYDEDTYGNERYWHCSEPTVMTVPANELFADVTHSGGVNLCQSHAEEYGFE